MSPTVSPQSFSPQSSPEILSVALKEWQVAVNAIAQGDSILLLRKGGIREAQGKFQVKYNRVWLYPTTEHQKPELLKPEYAQGVETHPAGWHPEQVTLTAWADVTHIIPVDQAAAVEALTPFHVWSDRLATERFNWKPKQPLYVLLLRAYRLETPVAIPYKSEYGGCRSWLDLDVDLATTPATPALSDEAYQAQVKQIQQAIGERRKV